MSRLPVVVPPEVDGQILEVVLHIARGSARNALAWEARLRAALDAPGDFHGHAVDQDASDRVGQPLRKVVFERTYLIPYRVDTPPTAAEIVIVRNGARPPRPGEP